MIERVRSSFRDPSGFLFSHEGVLYRQVNPSYAEDYDHLMASGLYQELVDAELLVPHEEVSPPNGVTGAYRVLRPDRIPFISYPYEWSFSQLKDAALLTLEIQRRAVARGMTLKDASAFNVQFTGGVPVFIDTLSFTRLAPNAPWVAYRQFCEHFLAPLALASRCDVRLTALLSQFLDGIPLDLTSRLLPRTSWFRFGSLMHLHLHSRSQKRHKNTSLRQSGVRQTMSRTALLGLIDSLESAVRGTRWSAEGTEWADYTTEHNYSTAAMAHKQALVAELIGEQRGRTVWDLGANTGVFSRIASEAGAMVVALDVDPAAVDRHYRAVNSRRDRTVLPLLSNLSNAPSRLGWAGEERQSLEDRGPADLLLVLALVHHLAIGNNVPLADIASYLARLGRAAIVEFVPKSDSQVQRMLGSREDIFPDYTREGFERAFSGSFRIDRVEPITETDRVLYRMEARG